ncbi:hypothetical protein FACS1894178_7630 [Bacteroidia bacterium]|nr:hypothetical protein FACS1894178_7630 [Bacteroidia bacterium]
MKYEISKDFEKSARKLSGNYKESLKAVIKEIIFADTIDVLTDCKKLTGFQSVYRIRIGTYRLFLFFEVKDNVIYLQYLVSRGEAYSKKYMDKLKNIDK